MFTTTKTNYNIISNTLHTSCGNQICRVFLKNTTTADTLLKSIKKSFSQITQHYAHELMSLTPTVKNHSLAVAFLNWQLALNSYTAMAPYENYCES